MVMGFSQKRAGGDDPLLPLMSLSSFRSPRSPSGSRPIAGIVQEHRDPKAARLQEDCRHMVGTELEYSWNILGMLPPHCKNIAGIFWPHSCHIV